MTRGILVFVLLVLSAAPANAEGDPFAWPQAHRATARGISDALVLGQIGMDTIASVRSAHRGRAFGCQAARLGVTIGAAELTKAIVHRTRPDGSDDKSFYSEHTAIAMASSGWHYGVGITIGVGTGYLRMAAARHFPTDVAVGAGVGLVASRICGER